MRKRDETGKGESDTASAEPSMGKRIDVNFGASESKQASAEPSERTVAEWTKVLGLRRSIVAGAAHLAGWKPETELTRKAFETGVAKYTETPMGG